VALAGLWGCKFKTHFFSNFTAVETFSLSLKVSTYVDFAIMLVKVAKNCTVTACVLLSLLCVAAVYSVTGRW
jgi:hypothetical protein